MADAILAQCAIYQIKNTVNGKLYIGSSSNLKKRASEHWRNLRNNCHVNDRLQKAYNKYGRDAFVLSVVEPVSSIDALLQREQFWIDLHRCSDRLVGYNIAHFAGPSMRGRTHNDAAKAKMSLAGKGRIRPQEVRDRISAGRMGHTVSESTREKIGASQLGRKHSAEVRARRAKSLVGKKRSAETIAKMSGKIMSEETKAKISAANKGVPKSAEHRAKLSTANVGFSRGPQSPEVVAKRVASTRATKLAKAAIGSVEL